MSLATSSLSRTFYVTPHSRGYPAMLVDLERVEREQLRELLIEAWCRRAPKRLLKARSGPPDPAED